MRSLLRDFESKGGESIGFATDSPQRPGESPVGVSAVQVRTRVQEVVGESWSKAILYGSAESPVDAISEAVTAKLLDNPTHFTEKREER